MRCPLHLFVQQLPRHSCSEYSAGAFFGNVSATLFLYTNYKFSTSVVQKVTKRYDNFRSFLTCTGNYRYFQICCSARKSNCTNARGGIAHLVQSCITLIDFLYRMCHTNVAGNVPDNVPETLSESEARRHGKPDHQGHRTDQRLLCQHHLPCDQRQAGCPPGDQGARSESDAGGRVRAQHQRPTAEDPAVPQSGVRS